MTRRNIPSKRCEAINLTEFDAPAGGQCVKEATHVHEGRRCCWTHYVTIFMGPRARQEMQVTTERGETRTWARLPPVTFIAALLLCLVIGCSGESSTSSPAPCDPCDASSCGAASSCVVYDNGNRCTTADELAAFECAPCLACGTRNPQAECCW